MIVGYFSLSLFFLIAFSIIFFIFYKKSQKKILNLEKEKAVYDLLQKEHQELSTYVKSLEEDLGKERVLCSEYKTRYEEMKKSSEEKIQLIEENQEKLKQSFKALSLEALEKNNNHFLTLAKESFDKAHEKAESHLQKKKESIDQLFTPLKESLEKMGEGMQKLEKERKEDHLSLREKLNQMIDQEKELKLETQSLIRALRTPNIRGRWGEIQLRRVAELSGMVNHCDFVEQKQDLEEGRSRPDMIINLPGNRQVIVDAKTPFEAYLDAMQTSDDHVRESKLKTHAKHIRQHIISLGKKAYWQKFEQTPEFVVLFLPSEGFFSAALEQDPTLIEIGVDQGVILATPMTLIGLLRAISYGWKQERLSQSAEEIAALGKELYKRLIDMQGHITKLGKAIHSSVENYNKMLGSYESRVLVSGRKFQKMGIGIEEEAPVSKLLEQMPRQVIEQDKD